MKVIRTAAVATIVALAAYGVAANAEQMKELAIYKGNLGKWTCDAKELGSGKAFKSIAEFSVEFDGNTFIERYYEIANADHPNAWKGIFIMSYDPQSRRWVRSGVDNAGERNAASSSGWNGNTWVWENDAVNIVINQQSTNARTVAIDVKDPAGVKRVVEASCRRDS